MVPAAADLLAELHRTNRAALPLLPARFEDREMTTRAIQALLAKRRAKGFAAFRDDKLVAYMIGDNETLPWGRSGHVYLPGYAVNNGERAEIIQDLYALLGDEWVKNGVFNHYLYISAADRTILEALFDIGFGKERVDALLDLASLRIPEVEEPSGVTIRLAGKGDNELVGSLSNVIFSALADAPYWHPTVPEDWAELHEGWSALADDKEWTFWLALEGEKALGGIGFRAEAEEDTQMLIPARTAYLSVAATKPEARGRGVGTTLTWLGLAKTREDGFELCYTNWISPNLLASRFWPRFGFKDVAYRLAKKVSPMISWAKS